MRHIVIAGILLLSACASETHPGPMTQEEYFEGAKVAEEKVAAVGQGFADTFRDNFHKTGRQIKQWWFTRPEKQDKQSVPPSYCYHVHQDVLCYRQPMPGSEHRLIGYQGTYAAPPPPSVMRLLPTGGADKSQLPANRVATSKPVFGEIPSDLQEERKEHQEEAEPEAAHEILPDPALAPQL